MMANCINCENSISEDARKFVLKDRRKGLSGYWQLIECNTCGMISISPTPTEEQLDEYYESYSTNNSVNDKKGLGTRFPKLRRLFHSINGEIDPRDFIDVRKGARVLDYGCGHASFLSDFHDMGIDIIGVERMEYIAEACQKRGLKVYKVDDSSPLPFVDESFDIAYLTQVFEHLSDPNRLLKELNRILKNNGVLYITIPNVKSFWRKIFRNNWITGWFVPYHIYYYDRDIISNIARKNGFNVIGSRSNTPETWFRLNLKAILYPKDNHLEQKYSWIDSLFARIIISILLRIIELTVSERDCLLMIFIKQPIR